MQRVRAREAAEYLIGRQLRRSPTLGWRTSPNNSQTFVCVVSRLAPAYKRAKRQATREAAVLKSSTQSEAAGARSPRFNQLATKKPLKHVGRLKGDFCATVDKSAARLHSDGGGMLIDT